MGAAMGDRIPTARLAAVQAAPVWLDREASVDKACGLIEEAGRNGAQIIGFPEGFLPGFPDWYHWYMPRAPQSIRFAKELIKNAVEVPSAATEALCAAAKRANAHVVIGINEREPNALGSLYNAQLFIGPDGGILGVHRKLVPTLTERLIHSYSDGSSVRTYETPNGAIGGLICGENTNSLARFALLAQNERIHVASWPAFVLGNRNSFDSIDIRVRYHAFEGRVFVISAAGILDDACLDAMELDDEQRATFSCRGGHSGILGPTGQYIAGPADDTEQILYADADMEKIIEGKLSHDLTGHYNRFDVFTLLMKDVPREPLRREAGVDDADSDQADTEHTGLVQLHSPARR
jgi:aliphatic nitrilase